MRMTPLDCVGLPVMGSIMVEAEVMTFPAASKVPSLTIRAVHMLSIQVETYFFLVLSYPVYPTPWNGCPIAEPVNCCSIQLPPRIDLFTLVPADFAGGWPGAIHIETSASHVPSMPRRRLWGSPTALAAAQASIIAFCSADIGGCPAGFVSWAPAAPAASPAQSTNAH